jgi:serine protease Do
MAARLFRAAFRHNHVTFMRGVERLRAKPAYWLLAAMMSAAVSLAAPPPVVPLDSTQTNRPGRSVKIWPRETAPDTSALTVPAVPKPTPARRADLPTAFIGNAPSSVADLRTMERHVKALVARVSPAVVAVEVGNGSGSGVVISADGLVLTAGHVCGEPDRTVHFTFPDGKKAHGKTLGRDTESDTGLMRITDSGTWPHAAMGDLAQARAGDWVLALGHPGGFDAGRSLVVRLGRIIRLDEGALQTDCTISPGDSGGPLLDMHGRVIGIHSAISTLLAENFHVAISEFYDNWNVMAKSKEADEEVDAPRAYVGASGVNDDAGCRLIEVEENSPAARAGLKVGDVVLKVNGRDIKVFAAFRRWVDEAKPGETLNLEIKRGEEVLSVKLRLETPRLMQP